ncbi:MAG TPA: PPOX class F420-dependent oxidoreductase [Acidimicrobiales bacterium]|nr:PPOX class F420-dependent oxidoreductase [Acidimicrobiales bacterium]
MPAHEMTADEIWAFLDSSPPHTGKLATVRADGRPHLAPVWFAVDGREIVFTTGSGTVKGRALMRDGRVALCVDDERPPFSFVTVEGTVDLVEDAGELRRWAGIIGGRYMGDDRADAYGERNAGAAELLVRLRPTRIAAVAAVAD